MESGFEFTVEGQAIVRVNNIKTVTRYKEKVVLPTDDEWSLSTIQKQVIGPVLTKKLEGFVRFRTCAITGKKPLGKAAGKAAAKTDLSAITTMNRDELRDVTIAEGLRSVNVDSFGSVGEARQAVQDALDDKRSMEKRNKNDKEAKQKANEKKATLLKLNGLDSTDEFSKDV